MYKKTIATKIRAKLSWWTKISMLAMLVMYCFGPGTHHIGIMAAKLPFGNFDQKNCPSFSEPIFFLRPQNERRSLMVRSRARAALLILSESAKRAALLIVGKSASASGAPKK